MDMASTTAGTAAAGNRNGRSEAIVPYESKNKYRVSAQPLDFSFMKLQQVAQLRREQQRSGLRKEIAQSDDEGDSNKNENAGGAANEENAQEETKAAETKELVIRAPQTQAINQILLTNNISLQSKQGPIGGRKVEEAKAETKKKIIVHKQTTALFLQNNEFRTLVELPSVLVDVMFHPENLQWLDISYNYLESIDAELLQFTQLKTLYMHGNYIANLEETKKLNGFRDLQSLTLYGNPIETVKNYRLWVLGVMYTYNENLRRFDQVLVTNREFDKVLVWKERINGGKFGKRLKGLKPDVVKQAPAPPKTEEEEKKQSNQ